MGATWTELAYKQKPLDLVRSLLSGEDVVAEGTGKGAGEWPRVHYAAVRRGDEVLAYVTLYAKHDGGVVYKRMTERSLPYAYTAPAKVMAALTPTDNECALEWRAKVAERLHATCA